MTDVQQLQEQLINACVGHPFPEIMAALTLVTGSMISLHADSRPQADAMAEGAAAAIRQGVNLSFGQIGEVH